MEGRNNELCLTRHVQCCRTDGIEHYYCSGNVNNPPGLSAGPSLSDRPLGCTSTCSKHIQMRQACPFTIAACLRGAQLSLKPTLGHHYDRMMKFAFYIKQASEAIQLAHDSMVLQAVALNTADSSPDVVAICLKAGYLW